MLKHYFLAFRKNLLKQKLVAAINTFGLAIGLGVFILIALFVRDQYSYERHWDNADRLVRLLMTDTSNSVQRLVSNGGPVVAMPALKQYFGDDIELASRFSFVQNQTLTVDGTRFPGGLIYVDSDYIDMFQFELVSGSLTATLQAPRQVALDENNAQRLFGEAPPLGRTLILTDSTGAAIDYEVTAVYRLPVGSSTAIVPAPLTLLDPAVLAGARERLETWTDNPIIARQYFRLREGADLADINRRMTTFVDQYVVPPYALPANDRLSDRMRYEFQPLTEMHFNPSFGESGADESTVQIFAAIAVLVLTIGILNFVVLSVAKSVERKREIGIRKAAGAAGQQLFVQFIGESLLYTLLALVLALILVKLALPYFTGLADIALTPELSSAGSIASLVLLTLAAGLLGGWYPARVLARLKPADVLGAGNMSGIAGALNTRNLLVGLQFTIAIVLMIASLVLYLQLQYVQQRDPGFNPRNMISLATQGADERQFETLMNEISSLPAVETVALASRSANSLIGTYPAYTYTREVGALEEADARGVAVGYDFFELYQMPLLAGRAYSRALDRVPGETSTVSGEDGDTAPITNIMINLVTASALGYTNAEQAVGQIIQSRSTGPEGIRYMPAQIIGVVADSQFRSLREVPGPEVYTLARTPFAWFITARFQESAAGTIREDIETIWDEVVGNGQPFIEFVEQTLSAQFNQERREGRLLLTFAVLAIFVSCLGLYGLVAFEVKRRVREIGIRKVQGGSIGNILALFLWQFSKPVLLANILAWPIALWAISSWLQRFPYRIDHWLLLPLFATASVMALVIAWLTVASTATRAARARPAEALRQD